MGRFLSLGGRDAKARLDARTARDWSEIKTGVLARVRGRALLTPAKS